MLCVATGAKVLALAAASFTLEWTHSVQRTDWWERWEVTEAGLRPREARITSAGAGMELPDDAWQEADGWHYRPQIPPQPQVLLAASGATVSGWRLCTPAGCTELGTTPGNPVRLWVAEGCGAGAEMPRTNY